MKHTKIQLSRNAFEHNLSFFKGIIPSALLSPVVKANAYGHGMAEIASLAKEFKVPMLMVNYAHEAMFLRKTGYKGRVVIVGPFPHQSSLSELAQLNIEITASNMGALEIWLRTTKSLATTGRVHLKFNTGLNRQGFELSQLSEITKKLDDVSLQYIQGVSSHFANVEDVMDQDFANAQLTQMKKIQTECKKVFSEDTEFHLAASGAAMILPESQFDICRVGISIYGIMPSSLTKLSYHQVHQVPPVLKPVLSWKTQIVETRTIHQGDFVGYGCSYKAESKMRIGVLPVGYDEGYSRLCSNHNAYVLIAGQRCPVVGRICMNMMMVDVTNLPEEKLCDEVVLIGESLGETISIDQLATWSQTISYEALTRIHQDIPKQII